MKMKTRSIVILSRINISSNFHLGHLATASLWIHPTIKCMFAKLFSDSLGSWGFALRSNTVSLLNYVHTIDKSEKVITYMIAGPDKSTENKRSSYRLTVVSGLKTKGLGEVLDCQLSHMRGCLEGMWNTCHELKWVPGLSRDTWGFATSAR